MIVPRHLTLNNEYFIHTGPAKGFGAHTFVRAGNGHLHTFYLSRIIRTGVAYSVAVVDGTSIPALRVEGSSIANSLNIGDTILAEPVLTGIPTCKRWHKLAAAVAPAPAAKRKPVPTRPATRQGSGVIEKVFASGGGLIKCIETKGKVYFGATDIAMKPRVDALCRFFIEPDTARGAVAKAVTIV
jgi:hypothetical protein